ncbi:hypothetical protein [uncultured Maribacter sp.]|uniref:hypothetical protein n=1 Tax=uncultured Maribacter sp. TaxID=431308 RepID=UPI0030DAD293|tara:strand:- start:859 stop:1218 length:360 start_codon:yes stop_codon:yes gene_type:complete
MKKSFYLSIIALFGIYMMQSQDSTNTVDKEDNRLLKYDWSTIATTPYIIGKRTRKNNFDSYSNLVKIVENSAAVGSINYPLPVSGNSKMPVYEPKGIHKMRIFEIDTTSQFYLQIFKVL